MCVLKTRSKSVVLPSWPTWIKQMETAAWEHLPPYVVASGKTCPTFWDSPSFAHNLMRAFEGFKDNPRYSHAGKIIVQKVLTENGGVPRARQ